MSSHKQVKKHRKPPPQVSPDALRRRMVREHEDLLQNVEFAITRHYKENRELDDAVVARALRALIRAEEPADDAAAALAADILDVEDLRLDTVTDRLWTEAYRVVLESVHTHSTLQPGNRGYLEFVEQYLP